MTELTANIRASQQTISNKHFNLFTFPLLNAVPLINGLEERQRLSSGTLVRSPQFALSLPVSQKQWALKVVLESLNVRLAILDDVTGRLDFNRATIFPPTKLEPLGQPC